MANEPALDIIDTQLANFKHEFLENHLPIRVSFRQLCSPWAWAKRSDKYTHFLHKYPAKVLPYIPIFFLSSEDYASPSEVVMDNFSGTGTVLLESLVHPSLSRNAIGIEINPLARLIAKVKTTPINASELREESKVLNDKIKHFIGEFEIPVFANIEMWFSPRIQEELASIKLCIDQTKNQDIRDFFLVCYSSVIRDVSTADPKIAPPVLLNPDHFSKNKQKQIEAAALVQRKKRARVSVYFRRALERNIERMELLNEVENITSGATKAKIVWDDARCLKKAPMGPEGSLDKTKTEQFADNSIGLVITSPPYINAQKYIRTTKFELFWLGLSTETELPELDKKLIGTERLALREYAEMTLTGIPSADTIIGQLFKLDKQKAAIVSRYFSDMQKVFKETHRVLKNGGRFVLVIGDNVICNIPINTHEILADIALQNADFELETVFVDEIRSRGMITKRHKTGGLVEDEWIIVLRKRE